jgi:hypothetical protein
VRAFVNSFFPFQDCPTALLLSVACWPAFNMRLPLLSSLSPVSMLSLFSCTCALIALLSAPTHVLALSSDSSFTLDVKYVGNSILPSLGGPYTDLNSPTTITPNAGSLTYLAGGQQVIITIVPATLATVGTSVTGGAAIASQSGNDITVTLPNAHASGTFGFTVTVIQTATTNEFRKIAEL